MGQPITIYDKDGNAVTVYGRAQLEELLKAGHTEAPPLVESEQQPPKRAKRKAK